MIKENTRTNFNFLDEELQVAKATNQKLLENFCSLPKYLLFI